MPSATVEVKYVNQPGPGKKQGTIKTPDGTMYGVKSAMLGLFREGGIYDIKYESREFQEKIYHTVVSVTPVQSPEGGLATTPARQKTDDVTAERIFVCGIVNAAISSNQIAPQTTDLVQTVAAAREAWRQTFGRKKTATEEEMSDQIPF